MEFDDRLVAWFFVRFEAHGPCRCIPDVKQPIFAHHPIGGFNFGTNPWQVGVAFPGFKGYGHPAELS
mgnify:CR=1 FL=1